MLNLNIDTVDGAMPSDTKVRMTIETALDTLRLRTKQWLRLQKMTENQLYSVFERALELYYVLRESEAYMAAFKGLCNFKRGRRLT